MTDWNFDHRLSADVTEELRRHHQSEDLIDVITAVLKRWPELTLHQFLGAVVLYSAERTARATRLGIMPTEGHA